MEAEIIRTENISKQYEDVPAVSDMSLSVRKGEIHRVIGTYLSLRRRTGI